MGKSYADEQLELSFSRYSKAIEKFCAVRLGDAEDMTNDCVQETFCLFYRKLLDGEQFDNPRAFLYKTANIMVLKAKEKHIKNAMHTQSLDEAEGKAVYVEDEFEQEQDIGINIEKAKEILLAQLNEKEKELYRLKYIEKRSLKEIGIILGIPPSAVANRTSRLRTKVKNLVDPVLTEFRKGGS